MKRLLSYLMISAMAGLYSFPAQAAERVPSLGYDAALSLSIVSPVSQGAAVLILLPAITPAALMDDDYSVVMSRQRFFADPRVGEDYLGQSGWTLINTNPRALSLQPTYVWSKSEIGVRASVWKADRFFAFTFKVKY